MPCILRREGLPAGCRSTPRSSATCACRSTWWPVRPCASSTGSPSRVATCDFPSPTAPSPRCCTRLSLRAPTAISSGEDRPSEVRKDHASEFCRRAPSVDPEYAEVVDPLHLTTPERLERRGAPAHRGAGRTGEADRQSRCARGSRFGRDPQIFHAPYADSSSAHTSYADQKEN